MYYLQEAIRSSTDSNRMNTILALWYLFEYIITSMRNVTKIRKQTISSFTVITVDL